MAKGKGNLAVVESPSDNSGGGLSVTDMISGNFGCTQSATMVQTQQRTASRRLHTEAEGLVDQVEAIEGMTPEQKIATRTRILQATVDSVRAALPEDRQSLANLVDNLSKSFSDIGEEFAHVQDFSPDEQRVIDRAKQAHENSVARLGEARQEIVEAGKKWNIFGRREKAIAAANENLSKAEEAEKVVEAGIEKAIKIAEGMRSDRLQEANFEESFKVIAVCVEKTQKVIAERIVALTAQAEEALAKKEESYVNKEEAAKRMETLQEEVNTLAAKFAQEVEIRDTLEAGSSERAKKEAEVSDLQRQYEEAKASHDQMLVVFQSMEKATRSLEIGETSLRAGLHAHKVTLARLVSDSSVWLVEFKNRVAQIKAMASQQASDDLIQLGSVVRLQNAKRAAEFAIGSLDTVTRQAEAHPHEIEDLGTVASAMSQGLQSVADRWKEIEANTKKSGSPDEGGN